MNLFETAINQHTTVSLQLPPSRLHLGPIETWKKKTGKIRGNKEKNRKIMGRGGGGEVGRDISNRMTSTFLIFDDKSKKAAILTSAKFIRFCMETLSTVTGRQGVLSLQFFCGLYNR